MKTVRQTKPKRKGQRLVLIRRVGRIRNKGIRRPQAGEETSGEVEKTKKHKTGNAVRRRAGGEEDEDERKSTRASSHDERGGCGDQREGGQGGRVGGGERCRRNSFSDATQKMTRPEQKKSRQMGNEKMRFRGARSGGEGRGAAKTTGRKEAGDDVRVPRLNGPGEGGEQQGSAHGGGTSSERRDTRTGLRSCVVAPERGEPERRGELKELPVQPQQCTRRCVAC